MNKMFGWKRITSVKLGLPYVCHDQTLHRRMNVLLMLSGGGTRTFKTLLFKNTNYRLYNLASVPEARASKAFIRRIGHLSGSAPVRATSSTTVQAINGVLLLRRLLYNQTNQGKNAKNLLVLLLKRLFFLTGASVWILLIAALFMVDDVIVRKTDNVESFDQESLLRTLTFYGILKNTHWTDTEKATKSEDAEALKEEIQLKELALQSVWQKLKKEEGIHLRFGEIVHICGYKCGNSRYNESQDSSDKEDNNLWTANCFIEGINGNSGILSIVFERENSYAEWVATRIYLEMLKEADDIICNISGHLPNGLKNFTRFCDV